MELANNGLKLANKQLANKLELANELKVANKELANELEVANELEKI